MAVSCVQQLFVAFAGTKALSMAAVALGSLANISFPAISSIKSKSVPRHEQARLFLMAQQLPGLYLHVNWQPHLPDVFPVFRHVAWLTSPWSARALPD